MKKWLPGLVFMMGLVTLVIWLTRQPSLWPRVPMAKVPSEKKIATAIPYWDQDRAVASLRANAGLIDYISVFWYVLREDGTISAYPNAKIDKNLIAWLKANDIKVLALIANLPAEDEGGSWDAARVEKVIADKQARARHIADIVDLVKRNGFDGVNIDYESLSKSQRAGFSRFVKELAQALHDEKKILGVALHPKVGEGNPRYANGSQAQDWKELGRYVDQMYLMTYEQHGSDSDPGPAASPDWLEDVLNYARTLIPPEKIFAGIPLYGYDWGERSDTDGLTFADVERLIFDHDAEVLWDSQGGSWYFEYSDDGEDHEVWFEDERSVQIKLDLARRLNIPNLAFWRLGGEDRGVWTAVERFGK